MDKYRKEFNSNLIGTTAISNFKFYYASYKIQQQNGRATDINQFLDSCIQTAIGTSRRLKIFGFIPYIHLLFGTGDEQKQIAEAISKRRKDVEKVFSQDDVSNEEIIRLVYNITDPTSVKTVQFTEEQKTLVKERILKHNSILKEMHLGDRIFGYLLKAKIYRAVNPTERLDAWREFLSDDIKPSDEHLLYNPNYSRSNILKDQLEDIQIFFDNIGLHFVANIVGKDLGQFKD